MKREKSSYHKSLIKALIVTIFALSSINLAFAIGATYGIVQGSTQNIEVVSFEVYEPHGEFISYAPTVQTQNDLFALTITIPEQYAEVIIVPILDGFVQQESYILKSGETLHLDFSQEKTTQQQIAQTNIRDDAGTKRNEELSTGIIEPYLDEMTIFEKPEIQEEDPVSDFILVDRDTSLRVEFPNSNSSLDVWKSIVLHPAVITIIIVAYMLVIGIFIRKKLNGSL